MPPQRRGFIIDQAAHTPPLRLSTGTRLRMSAPIRRSAAGVLSTRPPTLPRIAYRQDREPGGVHPAAATPRVHNRPGRPHSPASVIGRTETQEEGTDLPEHCGSPPTRPPTLPRIGYPQDRGSGGGHRFAGTLWVHHRRGRPHSSASVIGRTETQEEGTDLPEHCGSPPTRPPTLPRFSYRQDRGSGGEHQSAGTLRVHYRPGRPHSPASVIDRNETQGESDDSQQLRNFTINRAAHTPPLRLSTDSGAKVNQSSECEKRIRRRESKCWVSGVGG
jgi:hypothetical protein